MNDFTMIDTLAMWAAESARSAEEMDFIDKSAYRLKGLLANRSALIINLETVASTASSGAVRMFAEARVTHARGMDDD